MQATKFKKNDSVGTPKKLYDLLNKEFQFTYDPCPLNGVDGFVKPWGERSFVNPPYSEVSKWLQHIVKNKYSCAVLIPFRAHCKYWREYVLPYHSQLFVFHRCVTFDGYKSGLPLTICLVTFFMDHKQLPREPDFCIEECVYSASSR